jgi:hypothetical protein
MLPQTLIINDPSRLLGQFEEHTVFLKPWLNRYVHLLSDRLKEQHNLNRIFNDI